MKLKIALSTAALILLPAMSFAAGCNYDKQAMSCAAGSVYLAGSKVVFFQGIFTFRGESLGIPSKPL